MNSLRASIVCVASLLALPAASTAGWQRSELSYPLVSWIATAEDGSAIVYAAASDPSTGESAAFRSVDAGATWSLLVQALPGDTAATIAVDPRDSARVFATTVRDAGDGRQATRLYASANTGASWRFVGDYPVACGGVFTFDAASPYTVYVVFGCSGELYASSDAGDTWQRRNILLRLLRASPGQTLYAVDRDGAILRSVDRGFDWTPLNSPPCYRPDVINALAVDPSGRLLVSTGRMRMIFIDCPGVFESLDGGSSWSQISELPLASVVIDESEPSRIYATRALFYGGVFESLEGGKSWKVLQPPVPVRQLALSPSGRFLYAATENGLYRLPIPKTRLVAPR